MADEIEIAEYDAQWPARFAQESDRIRHLLANPSIEIEHHGSTAVSGLAAKPVIDMLVAVESIESAEDHATVLLRNGYEAVDQRYRELWPERIVLIRRERGERVCHVHLMLRGHRVWTRLIAFRDHLRTHPDVAATYDALKRSLAGTLGQDRQAYMTAKGEFINRITDIAMRDQRSESSDGLELFIFGRFHARSGDESALEEALRNVVGPSREEAGCVSIQAFRSARDPRLFYIHSRWIDEAAFDHHAGLTHTVRFIERVQTLIDHPLDVTRARLVG